MRPFETATILELGARGTLARGEGGTRPFTLVGRTCVRGRRGALWNEWTACFDDGEALFLAEHLIGNELTLYEETPLLPSFDSIGVGRPIDTGFIVVERGLATRIAQWGNVESAPATYRYADLGSRSGRVATIDFGDAPGTAPRAFVGRRMTLDALGLTPVRPSSPPFFRVEELSRPSGVEVWLDVGDEGELEGTRWRVIGMVSRASRDAAGAESAWDEYVLFAPGSGLRWLVVANGHWSFVETIDLTQVDDEGDDVTFDGLRYELLSESEARITWATGELPWEVTVGETSEVTELIHAPWMLTRERAEGEIGCSRGVYLTPDTVAKAFGKRHLPRPVGRAPNQPLRWIPQLR